MRLNRVLLLAATITTMMFALVFTISCSGEDGKDGKNGVGCTVVQDGSDWNIICEGEEVGTLHSGDGQPGLDGQPGAAGAAGRDCWLGPKTGSSYQILCGTGNGEVKGTLQGCSVTEVADWETLITCGTGEVSICKNQVFDPLEKSCESDGNLMSTAVTLEDCGTKKAVVNPLRQYCGYGPNDKEGKPTVVYNFCGSGSDKSTPNGDAWNEEYCRYRNSKTAVTAGQESGDYCNAQPLNKDGWKGEYCGFASKEAKQKSVLTGICDKAGVGETQGPNEVAFGQGYCVAFKGTDSTTYSEDLCGTSDNNKPNDGKWKNEYCGFANASATIATKVYSGLCDDSTPEDPKGPHLEAFNAGYCVVTAENKLLGTTEYTTEFCGTDGKPNETIWKGEYCGYGSAASAGADKVYEGICDDDLGPNAAGWNPNEYCQGTPVTSEALGKTVLANEVCGDGNKINEGSWKGEYCGFAKNSVQTSRQTGGCDDFQGPNSVENGAGYCTVLLEDRLTGKTTYTDEYCGTSGKLNENKWLGQYCGFTKAESEDNDKVYTGVCEDGDGPNKDGFKKGYCRYDLATKQTVLETQFCYESDDGKTKNGTPNETTYKGEYCFQGDKKVGKCLAGYEPILTAKSSDTDAKKCVLPSLNEMCKRDKGTYTSDRCLNTTSDFKSTLKCNKDYGWDADLYGDCVYTPTVTVGPPQVVAACISNFTSSGSGTSTKCTRKNITEDACSALQVQYPAGGTSVGSWGASGVSDWTVTGCRYTPRLD